MKNWGSHTIFGLVCCRFHCIYATYQLDIPVWILLHVSVDVTYNGLREDLFPCQLLLVFVKL